MGNDSFYKDDKYGGFYNPYSPNVDILGGAASTLRDMMQILLAKRQEERTREQQLWERGFEERKLSAQEKEAKMRWGTPEPTRPTAIQEKYQLLKQAYPDWPDDKIIDMALHGRVPETKPSDFDKRKAALDIRLRNKQITQEQYDEALYRISPQPTEEEKRKAGATTRQANLIWTASTLTKMDKDKAAKGKLFKEAKRMGTPPTYMGIRPDMPPLYNAAVLNHQDGVAIPEDEQTIKKYDAMFQFFREGLLAQGISFKDFMKSPVAQDPDIDKNRIKIWYDIYK